MTATPTGRDRPGDQTDGPPTTAAVPGWAPAGRGATGPSPGSDCHGLSCSFPLCEWPWCDDDLLVFDQEEDLEDETEDWWPPLIGVEAGTGHQCCGCLSWEECDGDCCTRRRYSGIVWDHNDPTLFDDRAPEADHDEDRGGATVEAAVALSALVIVLVLGIAAILAVITQIRLVDAAGAAARLAARGRRGCPISSRPAGAGRGAADHQPGGGVDHGVDHRPGGPSATGGSPVRESGGGDGGTNRCTLTP